MNDGRVEKEAELEGYFPDRRESIPGGCGKNILFFTLRKIPLQSGLLAPMG
jgi:hypothetical protein